MRSAAFVRVYDLCVGRNEGHEYYGQVTNMSSHHHPKNITGYRFLEQRICQGDDAKFLI